MLTIDPADNLSFWHTNEYYPVTSSASWFTRIGKFRFPAASPTPTPTPTPTATPTPTVTPTATPTPGQITLSARGYKVRGLQTVDLTCYLEYMTRCCRCVSVETTNSRVADRQRCRCHGWIQGDTQHGAVRQDRVGPSNINPVSLRLSPSAEIETNPWYVPQSPACPEKDT